MRPVVIDPESRLLIRTRFVLPYEAWEQPHAWLQLCCTDTGAAVALDFSDPYALRMLADAVRSLLADYRRIALPPLRRPQPPSQLRFF